jgi:hypothetical protein
VWWLHHHDGSLLALAGLARTVVDRRDDAA